MIRELMSRRSAVVLLLLLHTSLTARIRPQFEHLSVQHGLSSSAIYSILQDRSGFLWVGTRDGLNKYDGYSFTVYKHDPTDSTSLSSNVVVTMLEDHEGILWIGTEGGGLQIYNRDKNNFSPIVDTHGAPGSLAGTIISALYEDRSGTLWVGAEGLHAYNRTSKKFTRYRHDPGFDGSISDNEITAILEDKSGTLWIGTNNGLNIFEKKAGRFTRFMHDPKNIHSISDNRIGSLCEGDSGSVWIRTYGGGLNNLNRTSGEFTCYRHDPGNPASLGNDKVSALCRTSDGTLWVGTYERGGLNILNQDQHKAPTFDRYTKGIDSETALSENRIRSLYEDRSGNVWIGTDNGLDKVSRTKRFTTYLPGKTIRSMYIDRRGFLWIGTMGNGIVVLDTNKHEAARYIHDPLNKNSLSSNYIYCFYEDRFGAMWIGTWQGGLNRLETATGTITRLYSPFRRDPALPGDEVYAISEDETGLLWILNNNGTKVFDRETNSFADRSEFDGLRFKDSFGIVWFVTGQGLMKIDARGEKTVYGHDPNNPQSINTNKVSWLCEDKERNIWIGAYGNGISKFNRNTESFTPTTTKEGLSSDFVFGVLADDEGMIWFSSEKGLARYDPVRKIVRNYDISDGLPTNSFYWGQPCINRKGEMFFGSVRGVVSFHPHDLRTNPVPPPIVLTAFSTLHKPVQFPQEISTVKEIEIAYKENVFSLEVAALDFTSQQKNQYAYMMEGFDVGWIYSGTRRYFTYTNLDPGEYIFRAKGSNSDGIWNDDGLAIALTIVPPFWLTWWFVTLAGVTLLGSIIYAYHWRINNLIQIERTRDRIARDLHDDVASTLGSVALYTESLRRTLRNKTKGTEELLGKISSLSLEAVESMGDIVWSVSPQHDTLNEILIHIQDIASRICTANGIEFEINIARSQDEIPVDVESRKNIYLIFKESMNNIVKHAHASRVSVAAGVSGGIFEMTIRDDGEGFTTETDRTNTSAAERHPRGHGIRNITKRAEEIHARLSIMSNPGSGTTIHLSMKMT